MPGREAAHGTLWKPHRTLAAILVMGVVGTCLIYMKARQRTPFVSRTISGYRCIFTLPADWSRYEMAPTADYPKESGVAFILSSHSLNPVQAWMYRWRNPLISIPTNVDVGADDPGRMRIHVGIFAEQKAPQLISSFRDGYPEPFLEAGERVLAQRHLMVEGCPVTLVKKEWMSSHRRYPLMWIACTPDHSVQFEATGASEKYEEESIDREMEAILSSLRIEKVKTTIP